MEEEEEHPEYVPAGTRSRPSKSRKSTNISSSAQTSNSPARTPSSSSTHTIDQSAILTAAITTIEKLKADLLEAVRVDHATSSKLLELDEAVKTLRLSVKKDGETITTLKAENLELRANVNAMEAASELPAMVANSEVAPGSARPLENLTIEGIVYKALTGDNTGFYRSGKLSEALSLSGKPYSEYHIL